MHIQRYPSDLEVTAEDFTACDWQSVLASTTEAGYEPLWLAFANAAELAMKEKRDASISKALWILADACAMNFLPNRKQPFESITTHCGWKTAGPDDFIEADLVFFVQVLETTDNPWLKARLADLLWVRTHKDQLNMALTALDCYLQIPIGTDISQTDWQGCWERAMTLAKMFNKTAPGKRDDIKLSLLNALHAVTKQEGWLALRVSKLLLRHKPTEQAAAVADKLASLAREYSTETEQVQIMTAKRLFEHAAIWFKYAKDKAQTAAMTAQVAECYVREGMSRIQSPHPSHGASASFYKQAIQTYRSIPNNNRQTLGLEEQITILGKQMNKFSEKSLGELNGIPLPEVDFREEMAGARQAVQGKTLDEALQAFTCITLSPFKYKNLRQQVVERLKQPSLIETLPVAVLAKNGQVIAGAPRLNTNADPAGEVNRTRLLWEMTKTYRNWLNFYVKAFIWPALDSLVVEHYLRETDLIEIARQSPNVPDCREHLFGKALFAGFNHDFCTALHLLAPQIEHMVRYHLNLAGANTTGLDDDGIQTENSLSTIIKLPEAKHVFGEDLAFEINALYCNRMGPNLRNLVAHGLLDDNDCQSIEAFYAWWLGLRLVCHPF